MSSRRWNLTTRTSGHLSTTSTSATVQLITLYSSFRSVKMTKGNIGPWRVCCLYSVRPIIVKVYNSIISLAWFKRVMHSRELYVIWNSGSCIPDFQSVNLLQQKVPSGPLQTKKLHLAWTATHFMRCVECCLNWSTFMHMLGRRGVCGNLSLTFFYSRVLVLSSETVCPHRLIAPLTTTTILKV